MMTVTEDFIKYTSDRDTCHLMPPGGGAIQTVAIDWQTTPNIVHFLLKGHSCRALLVNCCPDINQEEM